MSLPTNRQPGQIIDSADINNLAQEINALKNSVTMTASDHLDNITTPGIYRINTAAIATAVGAPEATSMDIRVLSGPGSAIPIQIAMLHFTSNNWGSPSGMRLYVRRRSVSAWTGWGQPFGPADNSLRFMRHLTESDHLDNLTTPGYYSMPNTAVATAVGAPEAILSTVLVIPLGSGLTAQTVTTGNLSGGRGVRVWHRIRSTGWSGWTGPSGNVPGRNHKMMLADTPGANGHLIELDHYATGSGASNGQAYGLDIHNYAGASQALVIHQYSGHREAFRLDNTDTNAGIYINNTQNLGYNPDGTGQDAPFLKFHPYNMGNFLDFAYLMDDLTFVNDTTKTWAFQSKAGPVLQIKNADGAIVGEFDQQGRYSGGYQRTGTGRPEGVVTAPIGTRYIDTSVTAGALEWIKRSGPGATGWQVSSGDTGWRAITHPAHTTGWIFVRRLGEMVTLNFDGVVFGTASGTQTFEAMIPDGFRSGARWPAFGTAPVYGPARGLRVTNANLQIFGLVAGDILRGTFTFPTVDPWPIILPGTPA